LPFWSAYAASKFGLDGLSECLRYELAPQNIRVVALKPGPVQTPIWATGKAASANVALPPALAPLYERMLAQMAGEVERSEAGGMQPRVVAAAVGDALEAAAPRARVVVDAASALNVAAKRLMPHALWERLVTARLEGGGGGGGGEKRS
jgi:NAD(P)-dependent dehydrogenase (short-subunit alcohol dehydrogenase family)